MRNPARALLPFGSPLGGDPGCQLGRLGLEDNICGKRVVVRIAGVGLCKACRARLYAIVRSAKVRQPFSGRRPACTRRREVAA